MKAGYEGRLFFGKRLGLILWLRESVSHIHSAEVSLLKNWRKKFAFLSLHVRHTGEAFLD